MARAGKRDISISRTLRKHTLITNLPEIDGLDANRMEKSHQHKHDAHIIFYVEAPEM